jgi:hypothetical protein
LSEFIYYLQTYDGSYSYQDDDGYYGINALPNCEGGDNGYLGLDCASDGSFAINYFNDQYCLARTGNTYNSLKKINKSLKSYQSCYTGSDLVQNLVTYSEPCTSLDTNLCDDGSLFQQRSSTSGAARTSAKKRWSSSKYMGAHKSWVTKLKYVVGGLFLLASFIMFTGILFTNRRRRRAMMMRKYRQSKKDKSRRSRGDGASRKSSKSRSTKRSRSRGKEKVADGVMT